MSTTTYDFCGWATKNDLKCSDGRIIKHNAFKNNDGSRVPLVWNHQHNDPTNILGHALLENREEGVYAYCSFNDTEAGETAKNLVKHGDVRSLSIFANQLKQNGSEVVHGMIREVSLVLAGANPGATIENIVMAHSDGYEYVLEDEAVFDMGIGLDTIEHADQELKKNEEEEKEDTKDAEVSEETESEESEETDEKEEEKKLEHADKTENTEKKPETEGGKTVKDVYNTLNEEQKDLFAFIVGKVKEDLTETKKESNSQEDKEMKQNAFSQGADQEQDDVLMHTAMEAIIADGKRFGSLKESFLAHADDYGIKDIDWLFPDAKKLENQPGFIKRNPDQWVSIVMNGVHHTPFSRIKMMFADLREDDARAKGYAQKGKLKKEEVFGLLKRTVEPTTIYKKQKLDRDDVIDIVDFDVVAWLKGEMRMMLDEEIARAILFGDGRSSSSDDKIDPTKIIPIAADAALYTITYTVSAGASASDLIDACVKAQDTYEGSGNTTMFVANTEVTDMLLIKDLNQRRIYNTVNDVALACSVNRIVKVPASIIPAGVKALIVDLNDYNVGADKGGAVSMFDDFDIDYNQQKYLIETRCSGALTKPFSAIVIKTDASAAG